MIIAQLLHKVQQRKVTKKRVGKNFESKINHCFFVVVVLPKFIFKSFHSKGTFDLYYERKRNKGEIVLLAKNVKICILLSDF